MRELLIHMALAVLGYSSGVASFSVQQDRRSCGSPNQRKMQVQVGAKGSADVLDSSSADQDSRDVWSSANDRPLYDGTNYTFPDTRTPSGIAQVLEVTFVHGCMQLAKGYVDVVKMFVAASVASYEYGFPLATIEKELTECTSNTANRPLMVEELTLRRNWYSLVYLTLAAMGHKTSAQTSLADAVPQEVQDIYGEMVEQVGITYQRDPNSAPISVEKLLNSFTDSGKSINLSVLEKAILSQSLRVAVMTPIVVRESTDAKGGDVQPPTPPIEGAFS
jgi:hypothetical protein